MSGSEDERGGFPSSKKFAEGGKIDPAQWRCSYLPVFSRRTHSCLGVAPGFLRIVPGPLFHLSESGLHDS